MKLWELQRPVSEAITGIQQPTVSHEQLKARIEAGWTVQQIAQAGNVGVATIVRQTQIRLPTEYFKKLKENNKKAGVNFSARVEVKPGRTPTYIYTPSDFDIEISKRIPEIEDWISQGFRTGAIIVRLGVTGPYFGKKVRPRLSPEARTQLNKNNYLAQFGWNVGVDIPKSEKPPVQTRPIQARPAQRHYPSLPKFLMRNPNYRSMDAVQKARADKEMHLQRQLELDD